MCLLVQRLILVCGQLKALHNWQKVMWCQNKIPTKCKCSADTDTTGQCPHTALITIRSPRINCRDIALVASMILNTNKQNPHIKTPYKPLIHSIANATNATRRHKSDWNEEWVQHKRKFTGHQKVKTTRSPHKPNWQVLVRGQLTDSTTTRAFPLCLHFWESVFSEHLLSTETLLSCASDGHHTWPGSGVGREKLGCYIYHSIIFSSLIQGVMGNMK